VLFVGISAVHAVNMDSGKYKIQFGNLNIGGAKMTDPADSTYNLTSTLGQTAAGQFQSNGFIVKAGFQYIYTTIPFTFSVSNTHVDLGSVMPNSPVTSPITLTVSFGGAGQYVVTAGEEGPMKNFSGFPVTDTACNGGIDTCTETLAKPWTSSAAYGFGYSMTGTDVPADFADATYFRPFADLLAAEPPATVMQSTNVTEDTTPTPNPSPTAAPVLTGTPRQMTHQSTLTFRMNVSPLQATGNYQTVIHFVATPSF